LGSDPLNIYSDRQSLNRAHRANGLSRFSAKVMYAATSSMYRVTTNTVREIRLRTSSTAPNSGVISFARFQLSTSLVGAGQEYPYSLKQV
jgi:hypothetical protein